MTDIGIKKWVIECKNWKTEDSSYLRSIFFQGNGNMGMRACFPGDKADDSERGIYMAGVFSEIKTGITDMINLPSPFAMRIWVDGKEFVSVEDALSLSHFIDMRTGEAERKWKFCGVSFKIKRSISFSRSDLAFQCLEIESEEKHIVTVKDFFDTSVLNSPVNDDQNIENEAMISLLKKKTIKRKSNSLCLDMETRGGVAIHFTKSSSLAVKDDCFEESFQTGNGKISVCTIFSSDGKETENLLYEDSVKESKSALEQKWKDMDIIIDATEEEQGALRYNIFSLIQNSPVSALSIGARGLTHGRYKGCYFWDTDVFILPYFLLSNPKTATLLLDYRLNNLDSARKNALLHNSAGARYPWMCSSDGSEQCESWDTGKCEMHVTADVAWSFDRAADIMDPALNDKAAELYVETARFWCDRLTYTADSEEYQLLFVKGPDEYCGVTKNNTYTNMLIKHNLRLALTYGGKYLSDVEKEMMKDIISRIRIPYSESLGTYLPDDTYIYLEEVDVEKLKKGSGASYKNICFDRLQRYKAIKQPDVLLLSAMLPEVFSDEEKENAWKEYDKRTLHDSTLSWGSSALIAYMMDKRNEGDKYLKKSLFLDLRNLMDNTPKEGLHIGANGTVLEAVMFGVLGLRFTKDGMNGTLRLPKGWKKIETTVFYRGTRYKIVGENDNLKIFLNN